MRALLIVAAILVAGLLLWRVADQQRVERSASAVERSGTPDEPRTTPQPGGAATHVKARRASRAVSSEPWHAFGVVTTAGEGRSIAGARVTVWIGRQGYLHRFAAVETDADGRFRVDLEPLRRWPRARRLGADIVVEATAPGFMNDDPADGVSIPLDASERFVVLYERTLAVGATIEGRVLDDRGQPVWRADVLTRRRGARKDDWDVGRETDAGGRFRVWVDEPGSWEIVAMKGAYGRAEKAIEVVKWKAIDVGDLTLGGGSTQEGVLVYPDGSPLAHAELEWTSTAPDDDAPTVDDGVRLADKDGRFRATGLSRAPYSISTVEAFQDEDHWWTFDATPFVRVVARLPRVIVRILDEDGAPVRGVPFSLALGVGEGREVFEAAIERPDGRADFYFQRGARVVVGFAIQGFAMQARAVELDELRDYAVDLELREVETGSIRSTLLVDGESVVHLLVLREPRSGALVGGSLDRRIQVGVVLDGITPGAYRAVLQHSEKSLPRDRYHGWTFPVERDVLVRAGKTTVVQATAVRGARLGLRFDAKGIRDGMRVGARAVYLEQEDGDKNLRDWDGTPFVNRRHLTSLDLLPPGAYRVRIEFDKRPPILRDVELAPGKTTFVPIELE